MRKRLQTLYWWVRDHISAVAFLTGFLWDTLTLTRIDLLYENIVFITYLLVAFTGILLVHSVETRIYAPHWLLKIRVWLPALVQFPLGGLFSGFVIFYTKSASVFASWPFLLILLMLFVGNEFFRKRYERLVFQVSLFYFALLSYLILVVPIVLRTIGTSTFVFSSLLSLFVMGFLLMVLSRLFPKLYRQGREPILLMTAAIFIGFNVLYFTNTIPPVPLALTEIGVYHNVVRTGDGRYLVSYEAPDWYVWWRDTSAQFKRAPGEAAYCFASVFAPTRIRTPIYHSWQWKPETGPWVRTERIRFIIEGGRDEGFRGYTIKRNLQEGEWRCVVETQNQQVIGEVRFKVFDVDEVVPLSTDMR